MNVLVIWSVRLSLCDPASAARAAQLVALLSYETCLCKKKKKKSANIGVIVTPCYVKIDPFRKCTSILQVFTVLPLSETPILFGLLRPCFRYVMSSISQHVVDWELRFCLNNQEKKKDAPFAVLMSPLTCTLERVRSTRSTGRTTAK